MCKNPSPNSIENFVEPEDDKDDTIVLMDTDSTDYRFYKIAGGSIIDCAPLFSPNASSIYLVSNNIVKSFAVTTGEWLRDLDPPLDDTIVALAFDHTKSPKLFACSKKGQVGAWNWRSAVQTQNIRLNLAGDVVAFELVRNSHEVQAVVAWKEGPAKKTKVGLFDLKEGQMVYQFYLQLNSHPVRLAAGAEEHSYFALVQDYWLHVVSLNPNRRFQRKYSNHHECPITTVVAHPENPAVATGDESGKVLVWWNIINPKAPVSLDEYHWHHRAVQAVVFAGTGSGFYSGGEEAVLVKWRLNEPANRHFLPRISAAISHLAVDRENLHVAIMTRENSILIYDSLFKPISVVQNFTWSVDDKTGLAPFPTGLRINPRTSSLVLNGRAGHLQFYSTHTKSLLGSLDITAQNYLCPEDDKVLFNTRVVRCALSMDWLATGEEWDDGEHASELRLKFWSFDEKRQQFALNTSIETPHQRVLTALEFSSLYSVEDLVCASVGAERCVKLWALEESSSVHRKEKVWLCVGVLEYRNLPIDGIAFSADGSLLAAGAGNTLCVWCTTTQRLKGVLSAPAGFDGNVNQTIVTVPRVETVGEKEKRAFYLAQIEKYLNGEENELVRHVRAKEVPLERIQPEELTEKERISAQKRIWNSQMLNVKQKVKFLQRICDPESIHKPFFNLVLTKAPRGYLKRLQGRSDTWRKKPTLTNGNVETTETESRPVWKQQKIRQILFATEEFSHLVIVCTEDRLMMWNLLTLRLQKSLKMNVDRLTLDTYSNTLAVFTTSNDLYILQIDSMLTLYQRQNLPRIHGAAWVPRRHSKSRSSTLDWQATSQLFFLTESQELLCLISETDYDTLSTIPILGESPQPLPNTPFAAIAAKQVTNSVVSEQKDVESGNFFGKSSIRELTTLLPHTMAPLNILATSFSKSLLRCESKKLPTGSRESVLSSFGSEEEDGQDEEEADEDREKFFARRKRQEAQMFNGGKRRGETTQRTLVKRLSKLKIGETLDLSL